MKLPANKLLTACLASLLFASAAAAQQKPQQESIRYIPLKVDILLTEYDGAKKVSSLPYTLGVTAATTQGESIRAATHFRLGVRVPISVQKDQVQYQDVGTDIDCWANVLPDGTYQLNMAVSRSSVYLAGDKSGAEGTPIANGTPAIRSFRISSTLVLRDGQSDESTVASDPLSGHILRISVTLHVVKNP